MIVDRTKQILNENNAFAKKNFGQNFLISKSILEKIVSEANLSKDDYVIEIGPGLGSLTEFLCINSSKVLCYEIDEKMIEILGKTLKEYENKKIIFGDFLKQDVKKDIEEYFGADAKVKVIANLPYYITTPIMFKLLEIDNVTEEIFMVQKEMGDRFTGVVNTKDYNALSVYVKYYTETKKAFLVGRNNFFPAPNVDSVILHSFMKKKDYGLKNEANFLKFIRNAFVQRRKTFVNNISSAYGLNKQYIETILVNLSYEKTIRSESLSLDEFVSIYLKIFEQ